MPRLTLDLNDETSSVLEGLTIEMQVSKREIISRAIGLMKLWREETKKGNELAAVKDGVIQRGMVIL